MFYPKCAGNFKLIIKLRYKSLIKSFDKPLIYNSITNVAINLHVCRVIYEVDYATCGKQIT